MSNFWAQARDRLFSPFLKVAAVTVGLVLGGFPLAVAAQGSGSGLILLPEDDGLEATEFSEFEALDSRIIRGRVVDGDVDPVRPRLSEYWISSLRLTDMDYPLRSGIARISGEREMVHFDLFTVQTGGQQTLRLRTISGINNLPERSLMRVWVNGEEIGTRNLNHIENFGDEDFVLPPDLLRSGRNRVQVEFRQHHRIFCGPQASFDLWSDIDLSRSGLVVRRDTVDPGIDGFLMALAAQASGIRPVEIRGLESLGSESALWRDYLVQRFNQVMTGTPIAFAFPDYWTVEAETPDYARITILPAAESRISFRTGGDGAMVMVLELAQGTRPEALLAPLSGIAAVPLDPLLPTVLPQQDVPFAVFGMQTEDFSQRYALRSYPFRLPHDWLVLTSAKARINLDYAYARGLPRNSQLLVQINGTTVRLLPLRDEGGVPITAFPIDFEARLMHPGTNTLSFELFIPGDPENLPCPTIDSPFLRIWDSSTLNVPYSPAMSIPDMDLAFAALTPDSLRANEMSARAFSQSDVITLASALARTRAQIRPSTLHLISMDDLGSVPSAHHRADRRLLEDVVLNTEQFTEPLLAGGHETGIVDPFQIRSQERRSFSVALSAGWTTVSEHAKGLIGRVFPRNGDSLNLWLAQQRGQAVLFQLDSARPDEIWMLRSPDSNIQDIAHAFAAARSYGDGPRGQVAVLDTNGRWQSWHAPDRRPVLLEPWSPQNFRAAMGNFVSARPIFYTIMMLGLSILSALVALRLVISTRENT